ncbi:DUF6088 family protein [Sulfuricurvum sp.]|uniref:DUF6088 family protein n=1 Tax=Sulfuricurvum sp. TaxID=2025608 RepID=UPI00262AC292|nr:DUF6088 family protein [Sulfuricurvum sp.]MDD2782316.1 DUF6088 family protein [Sulfuricurvum sp.]
MSSASVVRSLVDKYPTGQIFTYNDLTCDKAAAAIELSRLYKKGAIQKLTRGRFYKAAEGMFGPIRPTEEAILQAYKKSAQGYETGLMAYNRLGLTTQIPSVIEIATTMEPRTIMIGNTKIKLVRQRRSPKKSNVQLLQILDALRQIKKIPDATPSDVLINIKGIITLLSDVEKKELSKLVLDFTPRTRALVGAILEELDCKQYTDAIKQSLNTTTTFRLRINESVLKYGRSWKIL